MTSDAAEILPYIQYAELLSKGVENWDSDFANNIVQAHQEITARRKALESHPHTKAYAVIKNYCERVGSLLEDTIRFNSKRSSALKYQLEETTVYLKNEYNLLSAEESSTPAPTTTFVEQKKAQLNTQNNFFYRFMNVNEFSNQMTAGEFRWAGEANQARKGISEFQNLSTERWADEMSVVWDLSAVPHVYSAYLEMYQNLLRTASKEEANRRMRQEIILTVARGLYGSKVQDEQFLTPEGMSRLSPLLGSRVEVSSLSQHADKIHEPGWVALQELFGDEDYFTHHPDRVRMAFMKAAEYVLNRSQHKDTLGHHIVVFFSNKTEHWKADWARLSTRDPMQAIGCMACISNKELWEYLARIVIHASSIDPRRAMPVYRSDGSLYWPSRN